MTPLDPTAANDTVNDISPAELRQYIETHPVRDYLLIDVRQPEEYVSEHIPGACLIPVLEIESRLGELEKAPEPVKIFYCRSGGRSARAAAIARGHGIQNIFNLTGGILAWNGEKLPRMPNLRAFEDTGSVHELLVAALDLEKGARRFYDELGRAFAGTSVHGVLTELASAEEDHERTVYEKLRQTSPSAPPFEELMGKLRGDVLESGEAIDQALLGARKLAPLGAEAMLELAVDIELRAFDTYRTLAHRTDDPEFREVFADLANRERHHARQLLDALVSLPGGKSTI